MGEDQAEEAVGRAAGPFIVDGGASGVEYHPVHGVVLSDDAKMWMPAVRRFYERRLPAQLITMSISDGGA